MNFPIFDEVWICRIGFFGQLNYKLECGEIMADCEHVHCNKILYQCTISYLLYIWRLCDLPYAEYTHELIFQINKYNPALRDICTRISEELEKSCVIKV